jgi:hypothetical protein
VIGWGDFRKIADTSPLPLSPRAGRVAERQVIGAGRGVERCNPPDATPRPAKRGEGGERSEPGEGRCQVPGTARLRRRGPSVNDLPIFPPGDHLKIPPFGGSKTRVSASGLMTRSIDRLLPSVSSPVVLLFVGLVAGPVGMWETRLFAFSTFPSGRFCFLSFWRLFLSLWKTVLSTGFSTDHASFVDSIGSIVGVRPSRPALRFSFSR